jgi:hypothetical protein
MLSAMSNTEPLFVPEQLYHRRRNIHARFGGQEQEGCSLPRTTSSSFWQLGTPVDNTAMKIIGLRTDQRSSISEKVKLVT